MGHHQVLWLFGPDHELTEVGAMNIFMVYINDQGGKHKPYYFVLKVSYMHNANNLISVAAGRRHKFLL